MSDANLDEVLKIMENLGWKMNDSEFQLFGRDGTIYAKQGRQRWKDDMDFAIQIYRRGKE